jgi:hypothetical protein
MSVSAELITLLSITIAIPLLMWANKNAGVVKKPVTGVKETILRWRPKKKLSSTDDADTAPIQTKDPRVSESNARNPPQVHSASKKAPSIVERTEMMASASQTAIDQRQLRKRQKEEDIESKAGMIV